MSAIKFSFESTLGNAGHTHPAHLAEALRGVATAIAELPAGVTAMGLVKDVNGNTVGKWRLGETRTYAPRAKKEVAAAQ